MMKWKINWSGQLLPNEKQFPRSFIIPSYEHEGEAQSIMFMSFTFFMNRLYGMWVQADALRTNASLHSASYMDWEYSNMYCKHRSPAYIIHSLDAITELTSAWSVSRKLKYFSNWICVTFWDRLARKVLHQNFVIYFRPTHTQVLKFNDGKTCYFYLKKSFHAESNIHCLAFTFLTDGIQKVEH